MCPSTRNTVVRKGIASVFVYGGFFETIRSASCMASSTNRSPGEFRFFVATAQLWYCVVGLSISSHNAQNFRVVKRNILVKAINYRFKTLSTFKNNSSTPRSFHAFTFSISHLWYYQDEVQRKVFWKNLLYISVFTYYVFSLGCCHGLSLSVTLPSIFWFFLKQSKF